jgi:hypothetical protein
LTLCTNDRSIRVFESDQSEILIQRLPKRRFKVQGSIDQRNRLVDRSSRLAVSTLGFDCYATTPFDFFSALYFLKARRLFCFLRLCEFFRASCFMLILLVCRDKPAGCAADGNSASRRVRHPRGLESCVAVLSNSDTFSFRLLEGVCVNATASSRLPAVSRPPLRDKNKTVCLCLRSRTARVVPDSASQMLCVPCSAATVRLSIVFNASHSHMPGFRRNA